MSAQLSYGERLALRSLRDCGPIIARGAACERFSGLVDRGIARVKYVSRPDGGYFLYRLRYA